MDRGLYLECKGFVRIEISGRWNPEGVAAHSIVPEFPLEGLERESMLKVHVIQ